MRPVVYTPRVWNTARGIYEIGDSMPATFHQFGVAYEEFETGVGNYTTAVIELADGSVREVLPAEIKFEPPVSV